MPAGAARPWLLGSSTVPRPGRSQRPPARAPPPATAFLPARPLAPPSPSWDPHWVINSQRSCERLAEVVLSQRAAGLLSASDLGAALARAHALADPARPADRAATERLVALGWDQLGSLSYTPLVNLLLLSALCGQSTPQRMRAWVARAARDGALQDLPPAGWISLLEAACVLQRSAQVGQGDARGREAPVAAAAAGGHQAAAAGGQQAAAADGEQEAAVDGQQTAATAAADGEQTAPAAAAKAGPAPRAAFIPPRLLYTALRQTCCAEAAGRLSLRKLATLYSCAEELGLELSAAQHRSLCAAVQAWLRRRSFNPSASKSISANLSTLLSAWVGMQRAYQRARDSREAAAAADWRAAGAGAKQLPALEPSSIGSFGRWHNPIPGYPGVEVMSTLVDYVHANRSKLDPALLAELLSALGTLRHVPPPGVTADLAAALLPTLRQRGPDAARAAAAALYGLAKLGIDPGEEFCDACMAVAEADSGQDWDLLSTTAHSLAVLQRSTPERWERLLSLVQPNARFQRPGSRAAQRRRQQAQQAQQGQSSASSLDLLSVSSIDQEVVAPPGGQPQQAQQQAQQQAHQAQRLPRYRWVNCWMTAYLLLRERWGDEAVAFPQQAVSRAVSSVWTVGPGDPAACDEAAKVLERVLDGSHTVERRHRIRDPASRAQVEVDFAVPELRLAVYVERWFDRSANPPRALVGRALLRARLLQHWGWRLVVIPLPGRGAEQARRAAVRTSLRRQGVVRGLQQGEEAPPAAEEPPRLLAGAGA